MRLENWQNSFNAGARSETKFRNLAVLPCLFPLVQTNRKFVLVAILILVFDDLQKILKDGEQWKLVEVFWHDVLQ